MRECLAGVRIGSSSAQSNRVAILGREKRTGFIVVGSGDDPAGRLSDRVHSVFVIRGVRTLVTGHNQFLT